MLARGRRIDKRREHRPDEGERLARQVRTVPSDPDDRIAASGNESLNAATRMAATAASAQAAPLSMTRPSVFLHRQMGGRRGFPGSSGRVAQ